MIQPILQKFALVPRGGPGLACDVEGLALGPVILAKRVEGEDNNRLYRLLPRKDMEQALRLAYGEISDA